MTDSMRSRSSPKTGGREAPTRCSPPASSATAIPDVPHMKLGFFTMPLHPVGRDWRQTLAEDREAILLAEELGFEEAFIGEHVTDLDETITSCLLFLATLALDTSRLKTGPATDNPAKRHPA